MSDLRSIVHGCMAGDYGSFERLYEHMGDQALRTAYWLTRDRRTAEEVVQETFVAMWRGVGNLREAEAFRPWFFRILTHAAFRINQREQRHKVVPLHLLPDEPVGRQEYTPEAEWERLERIYELRDAISTLPEAQRAVVVLRFFNHLTEAETAEALGISLGTVKSRLFHARRSMERWLAAHGDSGPKSGKEVGK